MSTIHAFKAQKVDNVDLITSYTACVQKGRSVIKGSHFMKGMIMVKNHFLFVIPISIILAILFFGCAGSSASINTYVDPSFDGTNLNRIAIFPIKNTKIAPSEAQQLNRDISQAISQRKSSIVIVSSAEVIDILNQKGLADDWARFIDNYNSSGVPNSSLLKKIGEVLGVDALLQGEIVNIQQMDGAYGRNKGTTRVTVRYSMMGTSSGKLLWEASSDG